MRIGIVDLDTSHPGSWIPIERELGLEIVGLLDSGDVHPAGHAEKFAEEHQVPRVFSSLEEMAREVDCAIIHGCDWDTHIAKARPFVEAGKAVLVDKPLAGKPRDLYQLCEWAKQGARITGGSSLRFVFEAMEWLAQPAEERGVPHTIYCGCGVDEFNYGIHAYSLLSGLMGTGIRSARHLGQCAQHRIQVNWPDGRIGVVMVGEKSAYLPFYATITTEKSVHHLTTDNSRLYRALLETVVPFLSGKVDEPPIPMDKLIEPELCALAARWSWLNGDREVALSDLPGDEGYDGAAFAAGYRKAKYG